MKPIISAFMCTNRTLQRSRADLLQEKFVHIGSAHKCPGEVLSLATTNAHDNLSEIEEYSKMSHGKGDIISAIKEHIDIPDYLESCGYHIRKHGSKGKLTLKEHDSFVYDPARKRFYWNSRDLEEISSICMAISTTVISTQRSGLCALCFRPEHIKRHAFHIGHSPSGCHQIGSFFTAQTCSTKSEICVCLSYQYAVYQSHSCKVAGQAALHLCRCKTQFMLHITWIRNG